MKSFDCVEYEREGQIAIIRMNNPSRLNSMSFQMQRGLNGAFGELEDDDEARVAILTGVGRSFNAGHDTKDEVMLSEEEKARNAKEMERIRRAGAFEHRQRIPKPVIAAVNGWAVGHGWFVANGCDLVVAAESAIFWMNEARFGFQGGNEAIANQMLPFHLGVEIAMAPKMTAQRCYEIGLINKVVPDNQLMAAAKEMAEGICDLAPLSVQYTIVACRNARLSNAIPSTIALNKFQEHYILGKTEDCREAFRAFAERRKPVWKGK